MSVQPVQVVKIEALRALAAYIELQIPELAGRTSPGVATSSQDEPLPSLGLEPDGVWDFDGYQATPHAVLPGNQVVYLVGWHEGALALSLVTATPGERFTLEHQIMDLFLGAVHPLTGMAIPGSVTIAVTSCPALSKWSCSFDLESTHWIETHDMDRRYESRIVVGATVPALTLRRAVYTIEQLLMAIDANQPTRPGAPPPELVKINPDGTVAIAA